MSRRGMRARGPALGALLLLALAPAAGCGGEDIGTYAKGSLQARDDAMIVRAETEAASKLGQYQARYGASPGSLEQLEAGMGALAPLPPGWRYAYDPANPKVRVVPEGAP